MKKIFSFMLCIVMSGIMYGYNIWPIQLMQDNISNSDHVVYNFNHDAVNIFLWVWNETYIMKTNTNTPDFYSNTYGYQQLTVSNTGQSEGWTGCGYSMQTTAAKRAAENLKNAIVAHPDNFFLHLAVKSPTQGSHLIYLFGNDTASFVTGDHAFDEHNNIIGDFSRNDEWAEFTIPMNQFAQILAQTDVLNNQRNDNIFVVISEPVADYEIDYDAVYFYTDLDVHTVSFRDWNGSVLTNEEVVDGSPAVAPNDPTREGYLFIGWDKDFSNVTEDMVVTALYEEIPIYTLLFTNGTDESAIDSHSFRFMLPTAPTIDGFTFLKWVVVAGDLTDTIEIRAIYQANTPTSAPATYTNPANPAQKLIREGNVYILKGEKTYTIQGQVVR